MKGLFLGVAIFLICIALFNAVSIVAAGNNVSDYTILSLKGVISYLSNSSIDVSFDKTLLCFEDSRKAINSMKDIISSWEHNVFSDDSDLEWYERFGAFFVWLATVIGQLLNLIFQAFGIIFMFLIDAVEMIIWTLSIVIYFFTPVPKAAP